MIDKKLLKERRSRRSPRPSSAPSSASTWSTPTSSTAAAAGTKIAMTWNELEASMETKGRTPENRVSKKAATLATPESSFANRRDRPPLSASAKKSARSISDGSAASSVASARSSNKVKIYMTSDDLSKSVAAAEGSAAKAKNRSLDREALRSRRAKMLKERSRGSMTPPSRSASRSQQEDDDARSNSGSSLKARIQSGILRGGTPPASKQGMTELDEIPAPGDSPDLASRHHGVSTVPDESTSPVKNPAGDLEGEDREKCNSPSTQITQKSREAARKLALEKARARRTRAVTAPSPTLGASASGPKQVTPAPPKKDNSRKHLIESDLSSDEDKVVEAKKAPAGDVSEEPKASGKSATPTTRTPLKQLPLSVRRERSQREETRRSRQRSPSQTETRRNLDKRTARTRYAGEFRSEIEKYRQQQPKAQENESSGSGCASNLDPYRREHNGISVFVRKRPLFDYEDQRNDYDVVDMDGPPSDGDDDYDRVTIHNCTMHPDMQRKFVEQVIFPCSAAFDDTCSNDDVSNKIADPMVNLAARGNVATILMYGQTGSGKSFTMTGIEEQTADRLFAALVEEEGLEAPRTKSRSGEPPKIIVQFVELAGKSCKDLLGRGDEVQLADEKDGSVRLVNATDVVAESPEDLARIIAKGKSRRATEATDANGVSSRSHAILRIGVHFSGRRKRGLLTLIDCAGSERNKDSMYHSSQRQKESAEINASLWALKNCIRARNKGEVVPYRSSLLTRLLRESFERDGAKLAVIATVAPNASDTEHSCETLKTVSTIVGCDDKISEGGKKEVVTQQKKRTDVVPPRAWDHAQLVSFLERKKIDIKVPENIDGKAAMRMNVQQIRARLCRGNGDEKLPTMMFNALRKENDRVDKVQRKGKLDAKARGKRESWEKSGLYR